MYTKEERIFVCPTSLRSLLYRGSECTDCVLRLKICIGLWEDPQLTKGTSKAASATSPSLGPAKHLQRVTFFFNGLADIFIYIGFISRNGCKHYTQSFQKFLIKGYTLNQIRTPIWFKAYSLIQDFWKLWVPISKLLSDLASVHFDDQKRPWKSVAHHAGTKPEATVEHLRGVGKSGRGGVRGRIQLLNSC